MAKNILHMITPLAHMSPFDVNMALDAGYDATASYTHVSLDEVTGLVQDAMFSRSPRDAARTGVFIGGKDALVALDMLDAAGKALFKPFEISLFADPAGSFTTAAAMIAVVEKTLKEKKDRALRGAAFSVFGATGVVGTASAVIAALEGASVTLVGRDGTRRTAVTPPRSIAGSASALPSPTARLLRRGPQFSRRRKSCCAHRKRGCACSTPPKSPPPRNCWSQPTSTRCRRPASKAWTRTPTERRSAGAARSASARSRSAMSNIEPSRGCSGR